MDNAKKQISFKQTQQVGNEFCGQFCKFLSPQSQLDILRNLQQVVTVSSQLDVSRDCSILE